MNHKYIVTLTEEERQELRVLVEKGHTQGYRIKHAQILLKLDEIPENQEWTYDKIKEAYHAMPHTISQIAKWFVTGGYGIGFGVGRAGQQAQKDRWTGRGSHSSYSLFRSAGRPGAVDAAADCGRTGAPWGRGEYFRHSGDGNTEKNELKPWQKKEWCIPKPGAEFVARMEDILDVYQRPYDPLRPVVCLDETNRQLIEKRSIPAKPGNPGREDYEYRRCSVAGLFVAFEPLACKRVVRLTNTRTAVDFAHFLRELVEVHYSRCEKILLVMDNLNIHSISLRCIKLLSRP